MTRYALGKNHIIADDVQIDRKIFANIDSESILAFFYTSYYYESIYATASRIRADKHTERKFVLVLQRKRKIIYN